MTGTKQTGEIIRDDVIRVERRDGCDWVTLNRPDRLNALDTHLTRELREYFEGLYLNRDVRVVVLRGAGNAFCSGLDLREANGGVEAVLNGGVLENFEVQLAIRNIITAMRRCPQPIVSLVHGSASGGGFVIAMASDIRIAAKSARFNAAFIKIGLSGCDIGASYFLPRLVGASIASELLMTGRFLSSDRAYRIGLVSELVEEDELETAGEALVQDLLSTAPIGLRMTKETLGHNIDASCLEAALALEDRTQVLCGQTEDFREGVKAFKEKRPSKYIGR